MAALEAPGNWIGYRASVARAARRADTDDETLEICGHCDAEVDVAEPVHKPGCRGIGAPRANSATVVSPPIDRRTAAPARKLPPRVEPEGLDLLEAMDAGEPLKDTELAEPLRSPDQSVSSSGPPLDEGEAEGSGDVASVSPARQYIRWSREKMIEQLQTIARELGRTPTVAELRKRKMSSLVDTKQLAKYGFTSYPGLVETAGLSAVPEREPKAGDKALEAAAPPNTRVEPPVSVEPPAAATPSRSDTAGWIKVNGTGLAYRTPDDAYVAAAEIEADGERVASACREDGNGERADQAVDQAHELAEKIRVAARAAEERAGTVHVPAATEPEESVDDVPAQRQRTEHAGEASAVVGVSGSAAVELEVREAPAASSSPLIRLIAKLSTKDLDEAVLEIQHELRSLEVQLAIVNEARDAQEAA
jgi:hypothetical protein